MFLYLLVSSKYEKTHVEVLLKLIKIAYLFLKRIVTLINYVSNLISRYTACFFIHDLYEFHVLAYMPMYFTA